MQLIVKESGPANPSAPRLTLVHGWAMHGGLFAGLEEELIGMRIRRVDLPGHGLNRELAWPDRHELLIDSLADAAEGGWLAGWSLGGLLSMQAALRAPQKIRGLILIAATPCFVRKAHWLHGVDDVLVEQMAEKLAADPEQVLDHFLALEVRGSRNAATELRQFRKEAFRHGRPEIQALDAGLKLLRTVDLTEQLSGLDIPVLLIGGRRDRLVSLAGLEACARLLPHARVQSMAGAAHAPFLTDAPAVAGSMQSMWSNEPEMTT